MKILFASSSSGSRGGGELFLVYLGKALQQCGHELTLWVSSHPRMDEVSEKFAHIGKVVRANYTNTYDRAGRSLAAAFDLATARRAAREWRELQPDCIHLNKQNLEDGLDLLRALSLVKTPSICTIHLTQNAQYLGAKSARLRDWVARHALGRSHVPLVAVLDQRARDLENFLSAKERIHVVPNGVPKFEVNEIARLEKRRELGIADDEVLFIGLGRMVSQKRPLLFLETAQRILATNPKARFTWIGDGPLAPEWDAFVDAQNLRAFVQRLPWQSSVQPLLAGADVFLHVADFEGLPIALLEAMMAGLPCAISENLLREMPFLNRENSISVNGSLEIFRDRNALKNIGAAARSLAQREFSCEAMAARYESLYQSALEKFK